MLATVVAKVQNKSKVLKATKEKGQFTYKGVKIRLSVDISTEPQKPEFSGIIALKFREKITTNLNYKSNAEKLSFKKGEIKAFLNKDKEC